MQKNAADSSLVTNIISCFL